MSRWHLIIDIDKCENCNNCFLACKDEHVGNHWPGYSDPQPRHGHRWMNIAGKERGQYPLIDVAYRPTPCMHCDDPACMKEAGPGQVEKRPDGIVLINPEKARGNRNLVRSCPYDAIWWNETANVAQKCTMCAHLIDTGWKTPRCVQVCPTGALTFVDLEDPDKSQEMKNTKFRHLYPEHNTNPQVKYKNLYRFDTCFIAGSVTFRNNGKEECASGARVILEKEGVLIRKIQTDAFGDFKFDSLSSGTKGYRVSVACGSLKGASDELGLEESISLETILLA